MTGKSLVTCFPSYKAIMSVCSSGHVRSGPRVDESYSKNGISNNDGSHSKDKTLPGCSFINSSTGANVMASYKINFGEFDVPSKMTEGKKFKYSGKISLKALK